MMEDIMEDNIIMLDYMVEDIIVDDIIMVNIIMVDNIIVDDMTDNIMKDKDVGVWIMVDMEMVDRTRKYLKTYQSIS